MVRTADRCIHGLGDHSAGRGQVCRGALQVLPDPCGRRASLWSRRLHKHSAQNAQQAKSRHSERSATHTAHQFDVKIYCDGACEPNPGNAGSGIVVYRAGKLAELWYGLYHPMGTNNTAELNALYHALRMAEAEIKNDNTVEYRPVTTGRVVDGLRTVQSGLKPGERVVINGMMRVRPGMKVAATNAAMVAESPAPAPAAR